MPDPRKPLDDLLQWVAGSPIPTRAERQVAEEDLRLAFTRELRVSRRRRRPPFLAWAAAVAVALGLFIVFRPGTVSPAAAAMDDIAAVAETVDPVSAGDDSFVYTSSRVLALGVIPKEGLGNVPYEPDELVYIQNTIRETWFGDLGTVQIATTVLDPTFFNSIDETAYYAAGLDALDRVGETVTTTVHEAAPDWPPDRDALDQAIRAAMVTNRGLPEAVEYLDVALDIVRESHASPAVRAATLRLIGQLGDLEVISLEGSGLSTFSISYVDQGEEIRLAFAVDSSGYIRSEMLETVSGSRDGRIPPRTLTHQAVYERPTQVEGPG